MEIIQQLLYTRGQVTLCVFFLSIRFFAFDVFFLFCFVFVLFLSMIRGSSSNNLVIDVA